MSKELKVALLLTAADKMSGTVDKAITKAQKRIKAFNSFGNTAGVVGGVLTGLAGKSIADARESEVANKRLEQVFKSMGETNNKAAQQAEAYASKLQLQIGVEDEVILATQAKIATFKKVSNEASRMNGVFDRATQAAFDMAATGFGEADQNAVQLGKALQDPITGINALRRSGITFTDAEKKKIATLVKSNKILDAQNIILKAVESQVGGVASKTADPMAKMQIAFSEVSEQVGKILLPYAIQFTDWLNQFIPKVQDWISHNEKLVKAIALVGGALLLIGTISKIVAVIMETNPIVLAIMAIVTAAILIYTYWEPIKAFFAKLWEKVTAIFQKVWTWIKSVFLNYTPLGIVIKNWDKISAFFKQLWDGIKNIFSAVWDWVKNAFLNYTPMGLIIKNWGKITEYFTGVWDKVKGVFTGFWDWLKGIGKMFFDAGNNILTNIWQGIMSMIDKPVEAIKNMVKKIRDFLPFSPAKVGALKDIHKIKLVETIAATIKPGPALAAMQRTAHAISAYSTPLQQTQPLAVANNNAGHTFNVSVNLSGSATEADGKRLADSFKKNVLEVIRNEEKRKERVSFG